MTLDEWKEQNKRDEEVAKEIMKIERDFTDVFVHCKDMEDCRVKYEELYKELDDNGDYEKMKHLWKVVHRLNIRIKK